MMKNHASMLIFTKLSHYYFKIYAKVFVRLLCFLTTSVGIHKLIQYFGRDPVQEFSISLYIKAMIFYMING